MRFIKKHLLTIIFAGVMLAVGAYALSAGIAADNWRDSSDTWENYAHTRQAELHDQYTDRFGALHDAGVTVCAEQSRRLHGIAAWDANELASQQEFCGDAIVSLYRNILDRSE